MKTFTFGGIHGGSTTPENEVLSPLSLRRSVLDAPTDHQQFRSEDIRSQQYLTLITMAMVPGTITNSHILLAALQQLRAYCSLLTYRLASAILTPFTYIYTYQFLHPGHCTKYGTLPVSSFCKLMSQALTSQRLYR